MSNPFSLNGGQPSHPVRYAPLWNETFSTGLVTQRNPLRAASGNHLVNKIYGSKNDGLLDGLNVEVSNRLTYVRRPGSSIYNSQTFPAIDNFYQFRIFNANTETIKVIADTASVVYDATGPATKTAILNKSAGAGEAYFQSVGNTLYIGDGVEEKKWVQSAFSWVALTKFTAGTFIVDTNGNLQVAVGGQTSPITTVAINGLNAITVVLGSSTPNIQFLTNVQITFSGLTTAAFLNGNVTNIGPPQTPNSFVGFYTHTVYAQAPDTGIISTGNGITGATQPTWNAAVGSVTPDAGQQWINHGPAIEKWGITAPANAPTVNQSTRPSTYEAWVASTFYSAIPYILPNASPGYTIQQLTTAGVSAGAAPTYSTTIGATTANGTAIYTCVAYTTSLLPNPGDGTWSLTTAYKVGDIIVAVNTIGIILLVCTQAGTSGATQPVWPPTYGALKTDGSTVWKNYGRPSSGPLLSTKVSKAGQILDDNGYIESVSNDSQLGSFGVSGTTVPTWPLTLGAITVENLAGLPLHWVNSGAFAVASTSRVKYAYSFKNSVIGGVSTASPVSSPFLLGVGSEAVVQGAGSADSQVDTIVIYRTVQGGSVLLELDEIPVPAGGATGIWTYIDIYPDTSLNPLILAPIAYSNNPPPVGLTKMTYHLGRIWGAINNSVYFSGGPDTTNGSGNEAFPPANVFVFPSQVNRLYPTTQGLFVFTVSDVYLIQGTSTTTFFSVPFLVGLGLQNYNAFDVNGATVYLFTSDYQVVSIDLSAGVNEVGFAIGDQFTKTNWNSQTVQVSWHIAGSADKGLYVSDFNTGWFRLYPTPAPETGLTWAPFAGLVGGCSAVQSIETSPGTHNLLIGPKTTGPILKRDDSVFTDNGVAYNAFALFGSIVLAQPGQLGEIVFLTTDSVATGNPPAISVQLDEIAPYTAGLFETLSVYVSDPPELAASTSLWGRRYYFSQTRLPALCRHLQIRNDWGNDTVQNELLSLTLFGTYSQEL